MSSVAKILSMLLLIFMTLAGCSGGSSSGIPVDVFSKPSAGNGDAIFGVAGNTGITVTTDRSTIDANNGQVLVTARVVRDGAAVSGLSVTFNIEAPINGPAIIESGRTTVTTDINGQAVTRITTGDSPSTTNVIVSATATIGGQPITANTTFQIVRGTGVITIGALPVKSATVDPSVQTTEVFQQQIPIILTDANGFARVGAPVTLSVYTKSGASSVVFSQPTINTDASGAAVFNASVTMSAPVAGLTAVDSVIYKATTADANPVVAYAASYYSVTSSTSSSADPTMILTTDSTTYDINDGSVLVTARIVKNGAPVANVPVTFSITAPTSGPASIEAGLATVTTDSNGTAVTRITTGSVQATTNVIVKGAATVGSQPVNATATFQIVPTLITQPIITLSTDRATYDVTSGTVLATAKIVRNGSPVAGVPVTFGITAPTSGPATIETGLATVTTDSNGLAVSRITTGNVSSPTNVIINATATVNSQIVTATTTFTIVPDISKPSIILTTDRTTYDVEGGPVTATAKIFKNGVAVFGVPVTYTVLSGSVTLGYFTPTTDRNGTSIATFAVGSARATSNAIIQATATVDGTTYTSYAQFQLNGFDPTALPIPTLNMTLSADRTEVDVNNGTVVLNANLLYGADFLVGGSLITRGSFVADQPVTFTVLAGPATIGVPTQQTDKNGNSKAILTTGNAPITTNVIVEASTVFDGKTYRAFTTIQIVRGGGVVMFTDFAGLAPLSQSNMLEPLAKEVPIGSGTWAYLPLMPFKITDSNGNPRVGVPVTLSVYSISTLNPNDVTIDFLVPPISEPNQKTITSDSAGMGIFNVSVRLNAPASEKSTNTVTVVYKAVSNDTIPVTAYIGQSYSLTTPAAIPAAP